MSTTTASQRPSRAPLATAPPTTPLPTLPVVRSRKPLPVPPKDENGSQPPTSAVGGGGDGAGGGGGGGGTSGAGGREPLASSAISTTPAPSRPHTRSFTASGLPTPTTMRTPSTPAVPSLSTAKLEGKGASGPLSPLSSAIPTPGKTLRKTASIGQFPLPPKSSRISSLPPSPLSASASTTDVGGVLPRARSSKDVTGHRSSDIGVRKPKARSSGYGLRSVASNVSLYSAASPSMLNGSIDSTLVASADPSHKGSDGHLSVLSPSASARSSLAGSYQTEGTSFEDDDHEASDRGRRKSQDTLTEKHASLGREPKDKKDGRHNVTVSVRVRPDATGANGNDGGSSSKTDGEWLVEGRSGLISYRGREGGDYRYDNVFSPRDHNARVYDHAAKRLVRQVMEGYHGTVFAYGMTGTGKTFSMQGTASSPGVIPLAIADIFSYIREKPGREFLLRVSYLEIYNEKIYDLLSQSTPGQPQQPQEEIKLREDGKRGVYATPLKEEIVQSPNQLLRVIARGDLARRTGSTQFNARSSRSHAVVQIVVESRERSHAASADQRPAATGGVLVSTLSLIDLAGSEKAADNKERRQEGAHINKSLLTLGTVIARLSDDDKDRDDGAKADSRDKDNKGQKHLPYRDSKLTRLLQPALSGNSVVSILCTIQLSSAGTSAATAGQHTGETLNTLKFASRAKNNIVSHAKRNEANPNANPRDIALLDMYRMQIEELKKQLEKQEETRKAADQREEVERDREVEQELERRERIRHEEQMLEMQLARTALRARIDGLNKLILSSKSFGVNSDSSRRLSSASMPLQMHRMSGATGVSNGDLSRPVSLRSRVSMPGRTSSTGRDSTATLDAAARRSTDQSTMAAGSTTAGVAPVAQTSQLTEEEEEEEEEDNIGTAIVEDNEGDGLDDFNGLAGDGEASLVQQNQMLQADLADKNRYIATLEKRLLQARRTSQSRTSMSANRSALHDDSRVERLLYEKDREIEDLRAKLDDQTRMVNALRTAARKRGALDGERRQSLAPSEKRLSDDTARPGTAVLATASTSSDSGFHQPSSARSSHRSSKRLTNSSNHVSNTSSASHSSVGAAIALTRSGRTTTPTPLSPVALLSPTDSERSDSINGNALGSGNNNNNSNNGATSRSSSRFSAAATRRRRSVDEMTQLLDQMIQDKVDSGHVMRGSHGSLRITAKRDTVMEQAAQGMVFGQHLMHSMHQPPSSPPPTQQLPLPPPSQQQQQSAQPPSATRSRYQAAPGMEIGSLVEVDEVK